MTATANAIARSPLIRAARREELPRADYLLGRRVSHDYQRVVAVVSDPAERLVGVVAWRDAPTQGSAGLHTHFDWTIAPGWRATSLPANLLKQVAHEVRAKGRLTLRSTRLVSPQSWEAEALHEAGFEVIGSHEHFLLDVAGCTVRQHRIHDKLVGRPPSNLLETKIEPLGAHNVGAAAALVRHFGLMAAESFAAAYQQRALQEFSIVLTRAGIAEGILLARAQGERDVAIEVLACSHASPIGSGRVCNELFERLRQNCVAGEIARVYFWAEPHRSPATRRIAARFGGKRVGATVQYGVRLTEAAQWPAPPTQDRPLAPGTHGDRNNLEDS